MDPFTVFYTVQGVLDIVALIRAESEDDQVQIELGAIHVDVRSLIEAPWHEGLSRLRQAAWADGDTRAALLREAVTKFDDVAARTAAPSSIRARAATLAACIWLGQGERGIARSDAIRAVGFADSAWRTMDFTPGELPANVDGLYRLEDRARQRAEAAVRIATLAGVDLPQDVGELDCITADVIAGASSRANAPPDGRVHPYAGHPLSSQCDYFGSVRGDDLATHWHQLRRILPEGEFLRWYVRATDLRVGATDTTLFAFKPNHLLEKGHLDQVVLLDGISDIETGRDWFDWYIAFKSGDGSNRIRFNLGAEKTTMHSMAQRLSRHVGKPNEPSY